MTLPEINKEVIDNDIDYAIEDGRLSIQQAEEMSWTDKMDWLDKHNHDYDPY